MKKKIELLILLVLIVIFLYSLRLKLAPFYYNLALDYYDQGLFDKALTYFNKSLNINSKVAITKYMLANTYVKKDMLDRAIEEYKQAARIDPNFIRAYLALGKIYRNNRNYEDALMQLAKAKGIEPHNQELKILSDEIYFEYAAHCLREGVDLFIKEDKQGAFNLLNKALKLKPDFHYIHYTLAFLYFNEHRYSEAQEELEDTIELNPEFWPAYKLFGDIYFERGLFIDAISKYNTALTLNYNNATLNNDLGLALVKLERYDEAVLCLKKALELDSGNINIRYSLASTYRDAGELDNAITEYEKIIGILPDFPHVYNDLGDIYINKKELKKAFQMYKEEIKNSQNRLLVNPDDPITLNNLAYALNGIGEYDKAKEIIEKVLRLKADYKQAYLTLSKIYEKTKKQNEALDALDSAKSLSDEVNSIDREIDRLKKELTLNREMLFDTDTIYLKNGRVIKGMILEENKERIVLKVRIGDTIGNLTFYRNAIERIVNER